MAFTWPKGLNEEDQMLLGIGALVTSAASLEYFFFVVLECLTEKEGQRHCEAIWLSHRSTFARIQMVLAAARLDHLEPNLFAEVEQCAAEMKGISRLRNYYGHARFVRENEKHAIFEGFELANNKEALAVDPVVTTVREVGWPSIKELKETVDRADRLYEKMLKVAHRLREHTGALHVQLPPL